jgi:iron complex outermembrane receptor protein
MNPLKKKLLATSVIAGLAVMAPSLVLAQTQPANDEQAQQQAAEEAAAQEAASDVEAVVVTGTRIRRNEFTSSAPIQVITAEQSTLEGLVDTAEILQQSTIASGSFQTNNQLTGFVVSGGPGANTISLRGLGASRTLVLLNGRRVPPAGVRGQVGPVDLNVIPQSVVERIEILKDGASSVYGSDAVAGVINIITKTNLDGAVLDIYGNQSFAGGGQQMRVSGAWGTTFDRGYFNVAGDYFEQKELRVGDRDDTACAADYVFDATTRRRLDYTDVDTGKTFCFNLVNNAISTSIGTFQYLRPGFVYPTAAEGNNSPFPDLARQARAGYPNTFPYANYQSPLYGRASAISPAKRYSLYSTAGFDLTDNIEAYGELLINRRESNQHGVRQLFPQIANGSATFGGDINPNNRFGNTVGVVQPIIALKSDAEQTVDYFRVLGGLRGDFQGFLNGWSWDLYAQHGKSSGDYTNDIIYNDRVEAVTAYSSYCEQAAITISGGQCSSIPATGIDFTSSRVLQGNFTAEEAAFLFGRETGHTDYEQTIVEGSMTGDVFQLPAGAVGAAVGFTWRKDKLDDTPGLNARNGNLWGQTSAGRTAGEDTVRELFGEVEVPLIKGAPFVESLDLQLSGRYTDYDSYGSNTTHKIGLNWAITPHWRLRATQGTSFRAPALYELFLANQTGFLGQGNIDPCINYQDNSDPQIQANCAAAGIPEGYTAAGGSSALIITGGGAGVLTAETSKAKTIGLIWTPDFLNLSVAVDYFDIEVNGEVRQFGAANILNQCYSSSNFPSNGFCSLFVRDPSTNYIVSVNDSYVNVANQVNRGIDLTVRYQHEFDLGRLTIDSQFTWQIEDTTQLLGTTAPEDFNGSTTEPDFTGQVNTRFDRGDWTFFWGIDMIGKTSDTELFGGDVFSFTRYACVAPSCSPVVNPALVYFKQGTEFTAYHDFSVRRKFDDWTLQVGIQNAFDERPPSQSTGQFRLGTAALNLYDVIGRRAFINVSKRW